MASTNAAIAGAIARDARRKLVSGCTGAMCPKPPVGATLAPGARVYDVETGESGEVIGSATTTVIVRPGERAD